MARKSIYDMNTFCWWLHTAYFLLRIVWIIPTRLIPLGWRMVHWNSSRPPGFYEEMKRMDEWLFRPWPEIDPADLERMRHRRDAKDKQ